MQATAQSESGVEGQHEKQFLESKSAVKIKLLCIKVTLNTQKLIHTILLKRRKLIETGIVKDDEAGT